MAPPGKLDVASVAPQLHKSQQDTKVQYRNLGRSGLRVSVPILGTASFGKKEWQPWLEDDEEKIMELLHGAYIRGLNTWDTANVYSGGWNEQLIGMAIKKFEIPRNKLIILTKISALVPEELAANEHLIPWMKDTKDYVNQGGLSRAAIFNSVEASLARLDTPYIDVLQIHRYDPNVEPEETMKALHDLVQAGKVRYLGASSMWTYQFQKLQFVAEKHNWTKFISMQNQYSLCVSTFPLNLLLWEANSISEVPRRGARDDQVLQGNRCRHYPMVTTIPRPAGSSRG
jgi:aryl-alcohol dehydrogenase-like predicted oxidoreductase